MRSFRKLILAAAVAGAVACSGGDQPPATPRPLETPGDVVLALFALSSHDDPSTARVDELFGSLDDEYARAALLDAVVELHSADTVEIVGSYPMKDLTRMGFDLEGSLAGGGSASFSVQVNTSTKPGTIVWFSGPGVEWPERRSKGSGLSTSAPPPGQG